MWFSLKLYLRDRWLLVSGIGTLLAQLFLWGYLFRLLPPSNEPVFLHYTILVGVDFIGPAWQAYLLPLGGFIFALVNYAVGFITFNQGRFLARLLCVSTFFLHLLLAIAVVFLVGLNK